MSIRLRLTLWYAVALAAALLLAGSALVVVFRATMESQLDAALDTRTQEIAAALQVDNADIALQQDAGEALSVGGEMVILYDARGAVVSASAPRPALASLLADVARRTTTARTETVTAGADRLRVRAVAVVDNGAPAGTLVVARSLAPIDTAQAQLLAILAVIVPLAVLGAALAGYLLATRALRPVEALRRAADEYSAHDLSRRLSPPNARDDELGRLGRTLDGMLDRLAAAVERQRRFTADASHELRTPIATVLAEATLALDRARDPMSYRAALAHVADEASRMGRLVDGLLVLARADATGRVAAGERVDLGELIARAAGRAEARGTRVRLSLAPDLAVRGDGVGLERVLDNLLENAGRYAPSHTAVEVAAAAADGMVKVTVSDEGPGIPEAERARIFERFHRAPGARGDGAGLGLAIAWTIVTAHGGTIAAADAPGGGARFVVALPAAP